ncbi:MAG: transposase [Planctomycetaceae bacterium]|nr:transposase [Planctomycetaceae bacterium]
METVLDVYQAEYDQQTHVLITMDEASRQLLADQTEPLSARLRRGDHPGHAQRVDDKYERHGVRALLMFFNPLSGWRRVGCRDSRTRQDWAEEVRQLLEVDDPEAQTVTLVCDNLNTHAISSLYHAFDAETAGNLRRRLRSVFTPKNGSWLNMAEMELSLLSRQCLGQRRLGTAAALDTEVAAWAADRNHRRCGTTWRFTTADARIKLQSLYPQRDV